ncbi:hypothetical protein LshimejAT787_2300360 [Lyophyllum shimeji]|uniref:Uncharacterized protein n=1 Tax=Lyophyllum shimeji TaxID=47721 RepID=A0A9P3UWU6_LYOSH|nr:hypothetical protein LshimejAT787_2300360 [Lyophyllum shimeji]
MSLPVARRPHFRSYHEACVLDCAKCVPLCHHRRRQKPLPNSRANRITLCILTDDGTSHRLNLRDLAFRIDGSKYEQDLAPNPTATAVVVADPTLYLSFRSSGSIDSKPPNRRSAQQ